VCLIDIDIQLITRQYIPEDSELQVKLVLTNDVSLSRVFFLSPILSQDVISASIRVNPALYLEWFNPLKPSGNYMSQLS
jgi:hypothetical protein